jgi:hypothetical protein
VDEFAMKVEIEKNEKDETESEKSDLLGNNNLFADMMNVGNVIAEKARKKEEKLRKMQEMKIKKQRMRPFIMFNGIKDNPIPYEQTYLKNQ